VEEAKTPRVTDAIELPTGSLVFVVDPAKWGRGYCKAILGEVLMNPDLEQIGVFVAGSSPTTSPAAAAWRDLVFSGLRRNRIGRGCFITSSGGRRRPVVRRLPVAVQLAL
jgi:hypothetical protein